MLIIWRLILCKWKKVFTFSSISCGVMIFCHSYSKCLDEVSSPKRFTSRALLKRLCEENWVTGTGNSEERQGTCFGRSLRCHHSRVYLRLVPISIHTFTSQTNETGLFLSYYFLFWEKRNSINIMTYRILADLNPNSLSIFDSTKRWRDPFLKKTPPAFLVAWIQLIQRCRKMEERLEWWILLIKS